MVRVEGPTSPNSLDIRGRLAEGPQRRGYGGGGLGVMAEGLGLGASGFGKCSVLGLRGLLYSGSVFLVLMEGPGVRRVLC